MGPKALQRVVANGVQGGGLGLVLRPLLVGVNAHLAVVAFSPMAGRGEDLVVDGADDSGGDRVELGGRALTDAPGSKVSWLGSSGGCRDVVVVGENTAWSDVRCR